MRKIVILLAAIASIYAQVVEQNLCGERTGTELVFVNDPAACGLYLWCNFDDAQVLQSVHQGACPTGFFFNPVARACDAQYTCVEICQDSDIVALEQVRVADATDLTCRAFSVCNAGVHGGNTINCNAPLVFNRNYGFCTDESIAPCTTSGGGPAPPPGDCGAEDFGFTEDPNDCTMFFFCNGPGTRTHLSCPNNQHFNPATGGCQAPELRNPLCPNAPAKFGPSIPSPPLINAPHTSPLIRELKNRGIRKLF